MNCKTLEDLMMGYWDRELNDIECAQLNQHIKSCNLCSKEFNVLDDVIGTIEMEDGIKVPENFEEQVMKKVGEIESNRKVKSTIRTAYINRLMGVSYALLILALVASLKLDGLSKFRELAGEYIISMSGFAYSLYRFLRENYYILSDALNALFKISGVLFRTYYYTFITLMALLIIVQKSLIRFLRKVEETEG